MGNPKIPAEFRLAMRKAWPRTFIIGGRLDAAKGQAEVDAGLIDLVGIGRAFLANPDLITRLKTGVELNAPDFATFYTPGETGYTDYALASLAVSGQPK